MSFTITHVKKASNKHCKWFHYSLTLHTDIWFVVSVPVLSEQMTDVQPRVSTEGKLRTMAFFLAMRRVPKARQVVMTAGRPRQQQKQDQQGKRGFFRLMVGWTISERKRVSFILFTPVMETPSCPLSLYHDVLIEWKFHWTLIDWQACQGHDWVILQLTLRNCSNCQSHCNLEVIDGTSDPGPSMDRIVEVSNIDDPDSNADQCNNLKLYISLN